VAKSLKNLKTRPGVESQIVRRKMIWCGWHASPTWKARQPEGEKFENFEDKQDSPAHKNSIKKSCLEIVKTKKDGLA
jgi:hypothetical protein